MRFTINILISLTCIFMSLTAGIAQENQPHLTPAVEKKLIYHYVHQYYVSQYSPPIEVMAGEDTAEKIKTVFDPERDAMAFLYSLVQGDVASYYSLLDDDLKQQFDSTLKSSNKTRDEIGQEWKKKYSNVRFELTTRIDSGLCVFIHYRTISVPDNVVKGEDDVAICRKRGWVVSDLKDDIVYKNWNFKGTEKIVSTKNSKMDHTTSKVMTDDKDVERK